MIIVIARPGGFQGYHLKDTVTGPNSNKQKHNYS